MVRSGLIFGAIAFVVVIGLSLISPLCAPCLGLVLGLAAGYVAGNFDKPATSQDSLRIGAIAGVIAGGISLVGGLIGGAINGTVANAANIEQFYRSLGITNLTINQSQLLAYQLVGAVCIGLLNIIWMGLLGLAGGALWYQNVGKKRSVTILPPQGPIPPSY